MRAVETIGELLADASRDLAAAFAEIAIPGALRYTLGLPPPPRAGVPFGLLDQPRGRTVMLAGPGVLRDRAVDGLRAFAAAANVGVANTWGAKGVFNWDSPHHLGTCGLKADDFVLLGFDDIDLLWTAGLDPAESPPARIALGATIVPIAPADLEPFAAHV